MKTFTTILIVVWVAMTGGCIKQCAEADYEYTNKIGNYWVLADKQSTIKAKSEYIDKYIAALDAAGLAGMHNATRLKTPDNSFDENMNALRTLQARLKEVQNLDPESFAYQTAIQQITEQEQGQAEAMTGTLFGCWMLKNHPWLWSWHLGLIVTFIILLAVLLLVLCVKWSFGDFDERGW